MPLGLPAVRQEHRFDCTECGQNVTAQEFHDFACCAAYLAVFNRERIRWEHLDLLLWPIRNLIVAADLKRNVITEHPAANPERFKDPSKWVTIPREDFDRLRKVRSHPAIQRLVDYTP